MVVDERLLAVAVDSIRWQWGVEMRSDNRPSTHKLNSLMSASRDKSLSEDPVADRNRCGESPCPTLEYNDRLWLLCSGRPDTVTTLGLGTETSRGTFGICAWDTGTKSILLPLEIRIDHQLATLDKTPSRKQEEEGEKQKVISSFDLHFSGLFPPCLQNVNAEGGSGGTDSDRATKVPFWSSSTRSLFPRTTTQTTAWLCTNKPSPSSSLALLIPTLIQYLIQSVVESQSANCTFHWSTVCLPLP